MPPAQGSTLDEALEWAAGADSGVDADAARDVRNALATRATPLTGGRARATERAPALRSEVGLGAMALQPPRPQHTPTKTPRQSPPPTHTKTPPDLTFEPAPYMQEMMTKAMSLKGQLPPFTLAVW